MNAPPPPQALSTLHSSTPNRIHKQEDWIQKQLQVQLGEQDGAAAGKGSSSSSSKGGSMQDVWQAVQLMVAQFEGLIEVSRVVREAAMLNPKRHSESHQL